MRQMLYTSVASKSLGADDVFQIVQTSARNNAAREVTGFLIYDQGLFVQFIEGPQESLVEMLGVIERDPRHAHVKVVMNRPATARIFPRWRMERLASGKDVVRCLETALQDEPDAQDILSQIETTFVRKAA